MELDEREPRHSAEVRIERPEPAPPLRGDRSDQEIRNSEAVTAIDSPRDPLLDSVPGLSGRIEDGKSAQQVSQARAVLTSRSRENLEVDGNRESDLVGIEQSSQLTGLRTLRVTQGRNPDRRIDEDQRRGGRRRDFGRSISR